MMMLCLECSEVGRNCRYMMSMCVVDVTFICVDMYNPIVFDEVNSAMNA